MYRKLSVILMLVVFAAGTGIGFLQMRPPSPPSEYDADYAAYQRLLAHLKATTVAPHPSGSKEQDKVRDYLLEQIRDMGAQANIDHVVYTQEDLEAERGGVRTEVHVPKPQAAGETVSEIERQAPPGEEKELVLNNLWVKLDAPGTDRGVLLLAHYDSKVNAPGAADDMVSVSALLEAIREQAGPGELRSDLYFLLTDGEEEGGMGAKAFVKAHPELADSIDLVVNFDARGNRGGLLMFETSVPNDGLLRDFRSASSHPVAFSFTTGLYRKMPNGTDLTSFLDAGYPGLNFAVAEGVEHYHRPSDSFENLDRGTAYDFLRTAMEMADKAGQGHFQEDKITKRNAVFFTFLPGHLVIMSDFTVYLLSALAAAASLGWLTVQIRLGKIKLRRIAVGTGWLAGTIGAIGLLSWGIVLVLTRTMGLARSTNNDAAFISVILALSLVVLALASYRMRRQSLAEAIAGQLPVHLLLTIGTTIYFYEIGYLFALSTLGMLAVALADRHRIGRTIASAAIGAGMLVLFVPACWLVYVLFMLPLSPISVALSVLPLTVLASFFAAEYREPARSTRRRTP